MKLVSLNERPSFFLRFTSVLQNTCTCSGGTRRVDRLLQVLVEREARLVRPLVDTLGPVGDLPTVWLRHEQLP